MRWAWITVALLGCAGAAEPQEAAPPQPIPPTAILGDRIQWAAPRAPVRVEVATLLALVHPAPGGTHVLAPPADGRLVQWDVTPGATVRAGQALAVLASAELGALGDAVATRRAAVTAARVRRDALTTGARFGTVAPAEVEVATADLAAAQAELDAVEAQLARRDVGGGAGRWVWRAPVDGVVSELGCAAGTVAAAQPCVTLVRPGAVQVEVDVPERLLARVAGPTRGQLTLADGRAAALEEAGRAPEIRPSTRSRAFHYLAATDGLLPGASGRATLSVDPDPADRAVPAAAVLHAERGPQVLVRADPLARAVPVEVIGRDGADLVVRGLSADDEVAVRGVMLLQSLLSLEDE